MAELGDALVSKTSGGNTMPVQARPWVLLCYVIMQTLTLPSANLIVINKANKHYVFDRQRKKYVQLTPEEWVKQHVIHYLINYLHYPKGLISLEHKIKNKGRHPWRADIVVHNGQKKPVMLIECKAFAYSINRRVLEQVMRYNTPPIPFIVFTNGVQHFCFKIEPSQHSYSLLKEIPTFTQIEEAQNALTSPVE